MPGVVLLGFGEGNAVVTVKFSCSKGDDVAVVEGETG
jgi:hypothetical protein